MCEEVSSCTYAMHVGGNSRKSLKLYRKKYFEIGVNPFRTIYYA